MRELKFRAWDLKNKTWLEPTQFAVLGYGKVIVWRDGRYSEETGIEVMQFTGMKDKNGKEIYESDFLRFENLKYDPSEGDSPWLYEPVLWQRFAWFVGEYELGDYDPNDVEVIGNLWENLELLKL